MLLARAVVLTDLCPSRSFRRRTVGSGAVGAVMGSSVREGEPDGRVGCGNAPITRHGYRVSRTHHRPSPVARICRLSTAPAVSRARSSPVVNSGYPWRRGLGLWNIGSPQGAAPRDSPANRAGIGLCPLIHHLGLSGTYTTSFLSGVTVVGAAGPRDGGVGVLPQGARTCTHRPGRVSPPALNPAASRSRGGLPMRAGWKASPPWTHGSDRSRA